MDVISTPDPSLPIETHPWEPFVPAGAKALFMGTFPPGAHRHSMDFFYPNRTNDFWRVMGIIYYGSAEALYDRAARQFRLPLIKEMLAAKGIAMGDTGYRVQRLQGNASDKFLSIVEPADLDAIMRRMPKCRAIATTGEKASRILSLLTGTPEIGIGQPVLWQREGLPPVQIWRLPSTSRAYPLAVEKKAQCYKEFLDAAGCL